MLAGKPMDKNDIRNFLQNQTEQFLKTREVVLYAAMPEPEKKHRQPRPVNYREESYRSFVNSLEPSLPG